MSNIISRAAFVGKLLMSREGRGLLNAAHGEKALTSNVLQELVAGSAWFQGLPLSKLGDFDSYLKAATKKVWALWTCADIIAEAACDQEHAIRRKRGKVKLDVDTSAAGDLIEDPNDWQTWRDLKYHTLMQLLVCGNAFWAKDEASTTGDRPKRLIPLNPKRMSIIIDVRNGVIGYVYRPVYAQDRANFSQPIPFEPHEIVHFRKQNPDNDFWGLGAVEAGENLFNDFINEDTWRQRFWGRGALPTTLLTLKSGVGGQPTSIPEAKWKEMKANWQQEYGGTDNAGKTAWLSGDWAVQRIGLSLAEMQSIEGRRWTVEQIAHQFKVPLSVLGLDSSSNYATANIDRRRFLEFAVKPVLKNFEQRVNKDLIKGFDDTLTLEHDVSGLVSLDELAGPLQTLIGNSVLTPNEAREVIGREKVDDPAMDRYYMTSGLTPLELNGVADLGGVDAAAQQLQQRVTGRQLGTTAPGKKPKPGIAKEDEDVDEDGAKSAPPGHEFFGNQYEDVGHTKQEELTRAERAKLYHKPMSVEKERIATAQEAKVARAFGGEQTGDNLPADVRVGRHAIEVKTIIDGKNPKITMHPESLARKLKYARKEKAKLHTVVVDMRSSTPVYFYRKGVGSFRLSGMEQMKLSEMKARFE